MSRADEEDRSLAYMVSKAIEQYLDGPQQPLTGARLQEMADSARARYEPQEATEPLLDPRNIDALEISPEDPLTVQIAKLIARRDDESTYEGLTMPQRRGRFLEIDTEVQRLRGKHNTADLNRIFEERNKDGS